MAIDIFPWLVMHHHRRNYLEICRPLIRRGEILIGDKSLTEGSDKGIPYHGFHFLVDGLNVFNTLIEEGMINDVYDHNERSKKIREEYDLSKPLLNFDEFSGFLMQEEGKGNDGAYIFNSKNGKVVRINEFNNNIDLPEGFNLIDKLPGNFVYDIPFPDDNSIYPNLGTKTRLAIKMTEAMKDKGIHAYQIKRSSYSNLGMGKVTHFNGNGLSEEFFFHSFDHDSVLVKGVYREYERRENSSRVSQVGPGKVLELDELVLFCNRMQMRKAA